jgi:hypothetical protein
MSSEWKPPTELPDLRNVGTVALDTEGKDDGITAGLGSSWPWGGGFLCGISVAYRINGTIYSHYVPIQHPDSSNFDREQVRRWLRDLFMSSTRIVTQNGLFDYGWLSTDLDVAMPPAERLEEIGALATMVDENRTSYKLGDLCKWRNISNGKDERLLLEGCNALGLIPKGRKKFVPQAHIWRLPAHYVGPYAEGDAGNTLALFESLDPVLDLEKTRWRDCRAGWINPHTGCRRSSIAHESTTAARNSSRTPSTMSKTDACMAKSIRTTATSVGHAHRGSATRTPHSSRHRSTTKNWHR